MNNIQTGDYLLVCSRRGDEFAIGKVLEQVYDGFEIYCKIPEHLALLWITYE